MRPLYDFRRVLQRLPRLVTADKDQARRLILGLHQRFWRANISDMHNLLTRSGMPKDVLDLIPEVIAHCQVCKKYSKVSSRPRVRGRHVDVFNQELQADIFFLGEETFFIMVDVATRYKSVVKIPGKDLKSLQHALMHYWMRWFGPPRTIVSDQESALMSVEAAVEFERFSIIRRPAGTTRGHLGSQKTATGLVEKHVDLTKLTMLKMRSECERQGMEVNLNDLAAEAAMAQNLTINVGGYTPHMAVTGTLPYPFFDIDSAGIMAVAGAAQDNLSVFERALRLRQLAMTAATQSIMESRIARAAKTRPQQFDLTNFKPGITEVEFHREGADDYGWRGPATLLKISEDQGTAILDYQGKPYLVPLRVVRHFRGVFLTNIEEQNKNETEGWQSLRQLMAMAEMQPPYQLSTYGYILTSKKDWIKVPKNMEEVERTELYDLIQKAAKYIIKDECHGVRLAIGVRKVATPHGTTGTLVMWQKNTMKLVILQHLSDTPLATKKMTAHERDTMCFIYFYHYEDLWQEESTATPRTPSARIEDMDVQDDMEVQDTSGDAVK